MSECSPSIRLVKKYVHRQGLEWRDSFQAGSPSELVGIGLRNTCFAGVEGLPLRGQSYQLDLSSLSPVDWYNSYPYISWEPAKLIIREGQLLKNLKDQWTRWKEFEKLGPLLTVEPLSLLSLQSSRFRSSPYSRAAFAPLLTVEPLSLLSSIKRLLVSKEEEVIARRSRAHTEFTKKRRNEFTNDLGKSGSFSCCGSSWIRLFLKWLKERF